jgi:uncharacterized iron-regulated protein
MRNGAKTLVFRILIIVGLILLNATNSYGSAHQPGHRLHISFNIAKSIMHGTSILEIPANSGAIYHTPGLAITGIWINDQEIDLDDQSQTYFTDPDHELTISPASVPTVVKVTYELDLAVRNSPMSDLISANGISLTGIWHPFLHQDQIFELTAEIPLNFEAVSEAEEIATVVESKHKTTTFTFRHPLSGINFIAGPFLVEKSSFGDNRELYTYFFAEDKDLATEYRQKTLDYLARYEKMIGPFPYKRFSVVENRLPTGYAMPTFTVLGQSVVRLPFITDTSLGHETLHQWFGNSVRTDPVGGNWAEGLVTMLADALYQSEQGNGREFRKNQMIKHHSYVHADNELTLEAFSGAQSHLLRGQEARRAIGYTQSAMLFHMLRNKIGAENFIGGLRDLYHRLKHQKAGWKSLITSFEKVTGSSLQDFFDQWLTRPDLPVLNINNFRVDEDGGRPVMRFNLHQANDGEPYQLSVPITVVTDNETVHRTIDLEEQDTEVEIPLTATPRQLIIDENYELTRRLAPTELPPVWSRFVGAKEKLAVLDHNQDPDLFQPMLDILERMGCRIVSAEEVTNKDISGAATIFLGISSSASRTLFAQPEHPATGMTVDIRENPLNPALTAILVSAANQDEVSRAARKINHYGKYSYLHFEQGRAVVKRTNPTPDGQLFTLAQPPGGIEIGANLSFDGIVEKLQDRRVVYIGESHTRYEDHLLQLRIIRAMYRQNPNLTIGMEMFSRSDQEVLDKYVLEQTIDEEEFLRQSHYMSKWGYDYRFYQPIINFARRNRIPVLAINQDKAIVSKVYKETGLDGLAEEELAVIPADLDIAMPDYRQRISSVFRMHNGHNNKQEQLNKFLQAQSLWDETMAESIASYLADNPHRRMAVIAGRGHVNKKNAIPPRVARRLEVKQAVVLNVEQREVDAETADFLVFSTAARLPMAAMMGVVLREKDGKVVVDKLSPHGMAGKSGIKKGDIILALDGKPTATIEELKIILFFKKKGEKVIAKLKRVRRFWPDSELEIEVPL